MTLFGGKPILEVLTAEEWLSLINGQDESGLPTCCANVSALRDAVIAVVRNGEVSQYWAGDVLRNYRIFLDGHNETELLVKLRVACEEAAGITVVELNHDPIIPLGTE